MRGTPTCPRCGGTVKPPGLWSSSWTCASHGEVLPQQPAHRPSVEGLADLVQRARVPVWLPWPLPHGWVLTGFSCVGDERSGARAVVLALGGPAPLGGAGELLVVAEEPGIGLAARYAGLTTPDPGPLDGPPAAKVDVASHPTALWCVAGAGPCAAYAGEALGNWLWLLSWPERSAALLLEELRLVDARELGHETDLVPTGALSPRLAGAPLPV
ncbi:hypothetical protein EV189_2649 [Motilibacter rhizosphaerae]|uniref:Phosphotransacetylase n=1 Tax=Motilibacter rhizosphaerae TaxID=598652 RepID=A0A4Q7NPJ3_9ACTN|nr:DUF6758 family protein [Motilibacter rhizosphaerae]RZS87224.1 hypothetical protein EV189_2649 [Motilibacter rhizosphaerae]